MFTCIYVPNFPVAAVLRVEPELKARAVAILEGKPPLEKIIAVNEKAGRMGITPGMIKAQAELCAELAIRPRSALQESTAHAALLDCARSFSPCVEDTACDTALLDLAGMESLFGPLPKISQAISDRAAALGLDVNVAAASNPDAAMLAARGFSGVTVIPAGKEAEQLGPLPVEVLFADRLESEQKEQADSLLETLDRWGIRNLCALAALPEIALSERLGQEGLRLQKLARGDSARTLVPMEEPRVFEEAVELEYPIVLLEPLAFMLNRLIEQLCARLAAHALATQELRLTLELENYSLFNQQSTINNQFCQESSIGNRKSEFTRTLRLPLPMLDAQLFLKLLQLDLNAHPPGAPIVKIHLAAEPARPRPAQGGLFLPPAPEPEKLELTLARISGMVGENKVGAIELLDTHHPEAFRMQRFAAPSEMGGKPQKISTPEKEEEKSAVTALRRFRPPLRADVMLENGQPVYLVCRKKDVQGRVLWKAGPWRSSGDWWEREAWARDEWDVALQNSGSIILCRLVHDLLGGGWFAEGTYD
jgi:protein ImuB